MWRSDATIPDLNEDEFTDPLDEITDDDFAYDDEDDDEPEPAEVTEQEYVE